MQIISLARNASPTSDKALFFKEISCQSQLSALAVALR
jgi:hypothetical protein